MDFILFLFDLQAPEICALYALNVSPTTVRAGIRKHFEANRYITDYGAVERFILKGRQSYQETMNCWMQVSFSMANPLFIAYIKRLFQQEPHIMGILLKPQVQPQRTFMQKFLEVSFCGFGLVVNN